MASLGVLLFPLKSIYFVCIIVCNLEYAYNFRVFLHTPTLYTPLHTRNYIMSLTNTAINKAKPPSSGTTRLSDGKNLVLHVQANGSKLWRYRYRFQKRQQMLALGSYPNVSLQKARLKRAEYDEMLAQGINPSTYKQEQKAINSGENTFLSVATAWLKNKKHEYTQSHADKTWRRLEMYIFPVFKHRDISDIGVLEILDVIQKVQEKSVDVGNRVKQTCSQIFRYGIATGKCQSDPTRDITDALKSTKKQHYPFLKAPDDIGDLLRAIDAYSKLSFQVHSALKLAPYVFVRPSELSRAEWQEIDFVKKEWHIKAERMKMKTKHIVPLSKQALDILKTLHPYTGDSQYIFPSAATNTRSINSETLRMALRRMGYSSDQMTTHGFRHMASTCLHEMASKHGWTSEVVERQLAHSERNRVKATYNHAEYLAERTSMMQVWADYLDGLRCNMSKNV